MKVFEVGRTLQQAKISTILTSLNCSITRKRADQMWRPINPSYNKLLSIHINP